MTVGYFDPVVTRIMLLAKLVAYFGAMLGFLATLATFLCPELWAVLLVSAVSCIFFAMLVFLWVGYLKEKAKETHLWMR